MTNVFIDGSVGTTGLRIHERLSKREDLTLVTLPDAVRKDPAARREAINGADIVFLCLPDAAAVEAVSMIENKNVAVIDTSTAHRVDPTWTYGFPELARKEAIAASKRIANPGCHASGFLALTEPLVRAGVLKKDAHLTCFSLTGYSGGGKKMIADYEAADRDKLLEAPRQYGIAQAHKHLPEMMRIAGLANAPVFCPIVGDFYSGMEVTVPVFARDLNGTLEDVKAVYRATYQGKLVRFVQGDGEGGFLSANAFSGRDDMEVRVSGNDDRILLIARFDNLGKGASGAAIQNMNILLGVDETTGLIIGE
ncbi:MAG: N-acetyl-gamma-glutamyl-phosphate reductase [Ruminococcaceae bacterium]|nr:N-acetyl-gamma-glutamyl-phosphate reductase [Oscillospiraceae bacterium]